MAEWHSVRCIIYKDNKEIGTFVSIKEATKYLGRRIDGSLYEGVRALVNDGWIPPERSQLYGYSAKRINKDGSLIE